MPRNNNVLVLGGSRNIGYLSAIRLLERGSKVTFLLRSAKVFDTDATVQSFIKKGTAFLVQGDALVEADVRNAWEQAATHGPVDLCLFTVGGPVKLHPTKGVVMDPPNVVTQAVMNLFCTYPATQTPAPNFIIISSTGLTKEAHSKLPVLLKPFYAYVLAVPHHDKLGAEEVVRHTMGLPWKQVDAQGIDIMGTADWKTRKGMPAPGSLASNVVIVRPALLTDGECMAEKEENPYRVAEVELRGYTISRKDTAHFVATVAEDKWEQYAGKVVNIAY